MRCVTGHENPPGMKFCGTCGVSLPPVVGESGPLLDGGNEHAGSPADSDSGTPLEPPRGSGDLAPDGIGDSSALPVPPSEVPDVRRSRMRSKRAISIVAALVVALAGIVTWVLLARDSGNLSDADEAQRLTAVFGNPTASADVATDSDCDSEMDEDKTELAYVLSESETLVYTVALALCPSERWDELRSVHRRSALGRLSIESMLIAQVEVAGAIGDQDQLYSECLSLALANMTHPLCPDR